MVPVAIQERTRLLRSFLSQKVSVKGMSILMLEYLIYRQHKSLTAIVFLDRMFLCTHCKHQYPTCHDKKKFTAFRTVTITDFKLGI